MTKKNTAPKKKPARKPSANSKRTADSKASTSRPTRNRDEITDRHQTDKKLTESLAENTGNWVANARSWLQNLGPIERMPGGSTTGARTTRDHVSIAGLVEANRLVRKVGSIDAAKATLDVLAKLK